MERTSMPSVALLSDASMSKKATCLFPGLMVPGCPCRSSNIEHFPPFSVTNIIADNNHDNENIWGYKPPVVIESHLWLTVTHPIVQKYRRGLRALVMFRYHVGYNNLVRAADQSRTAAQMECVQKKGLAVSAWERATAIPSLCNATAGPMSFLELLGTEKLLQSEISRVLGLGGRAWQFIYSNVQVLTIKYSSHGALGKTIFSVRE
ncbi:hypothetical protein HPG69_010979, partial [Diceros bicornis minor]